MGTEREDNIFLRGGGEMGKLIRAKDWENTALGDPSTWPQPLKTMVGVLLENPFGMYIAWGKEYTQIYNDGYRPILGATKHPQALGNSTKETFSEIWPIIGPMLDGVMEGEAVRFSDLMLPLNRNGYLENCYFDFSYSPIRLATGEVGGVLVTVIETTSKKIAENDPIENKNDLEFVIEAAQLGTYDYNPLTNTFSGNARLKEWFGYPPEEKITFNQAMAAIAETDRERVSQAINKVLKYSSGGIYDIEYTIVNAVTKEETIVHAKGKARFNEEKFAYRLNGTLEDVTERVLARKKIEENERNLRLMILQAPVAISIFRGANYTVEIANKYALELWGRKEEEVLKIPLFEAMPEIASQGIKELLDGVFSTGNRFATPERPVQLLRNGVLETVYIHFSYEALYDTNEEINGIMAIGYDVTPQVEARKTVEESEKRYHNLINSSPSSIAILSGKDLVITIANDIIIEYWGKGKDVLGKPYFELLPEMAEQGYVEVFEKVFETGIPFTAIETPVRILQHGKMTMKYYNFNVYPQRDLEGNINGLGIIATEVTSQAILNNKIKESEQNIRALVESAPFPIGVFVGEEMRISLANQSIMDAWGKGNDVVGKRYSDILPEFGNQHIFEQIRKVLRTGVPFHAKNQKVDIVKNGELKPYYYNYSFTPLLDASGKVDAVMNTAAEVTELHEAKQKVEEALSEIKLFKFMADTAADPFILMEEDGSFTYLNNSALEKWGYTEQEMSLLKVPDVDTVFDDKKYREAFQRAQREKIPPFETMHKNKQGHIYPVEINMGGVQVDQKNLLFAVARDISERKKAEQDVIEAFQKVEESEKRFRDSVKQAPLGIVIFRGSENVIEVANESYLQIIDKTEDQFVGKPLFETLPEVRTKIAPIIEGIYKTGNAFYGYEFPVDLNRHGKTEKSFFNFVYHPLKENNTITGIMVVATEVTATVKAKHIIEENEDKLKLIIEASELGIWDLDLKTQEMVASERCYNILGFANKKSLTQEELIAHVHPDDVKLRAEAFEKAYVEGSLHYQIRIVWEDQSLHWKDVKGKVYYDENNKPERMLGTVRDITEERTFHQQLLEREEKFRLLADSMPQFVWTSDPEGNLNYFNQSVFDFSGLTLEQIKRDGWQQIVHPDDKEENIKQWMEAVRSGKDFLLEHRFRKHNGEYRWQLSRAIPQKDADGTIKMWVGTSTDVQEQKMFTTELEKLVQLGTNELQQKNMALEKINKELQSFVYISSHDLQEPLRKIQIFASRIIETEYDVLSENGKKYFTRMHKSANRMQNLIQDLIAYSRTNDQEIKYEIVDLLEIIEDTKETLTEELEQSDVTFELNNLGKVKVVLVQFRQVVLNLISNSIKFAKKDQPVHIKISCESIKGKETGIEALNVDQNYNHIQYCDNGIGFDQQYSKKIFEVFQRLHNKEAYTGTGIGLAIVKRIIENHEGVILATGQLNKGATFDIYIPEP